MGTEQNQWTFVGRAEEKCFTSEEFEIVPLERIDSKAEFEVIPTPQVRYLDESALEIHENYFLFNHRHDSDSDIEILTKPVKLHSKVLTETLKQQDEVAEVNSENDEINSVELSDEEDDSEIEVIHGNHPRESSDGVLKDNSLEIIFSNNAEQDETNEELLCLSDLFKDEQEEPFNILTMLSEEDSIESLNISKVFKCESDESLESLNLSSLFEEEEDSLHLSKLFQASNFKVATLKQTEHFETLKSYGLKRLFSDFNKRKQCKENKPNKGIIFMRTPTLVFMFCVSVALGIYVGNGCASFLLNVEKSDETPASSDLEEEMFVFVEEGQEKSNWTNIWSSKITKQNLMALLNQMERKYNTLKSNYEDLKDSYQLQKQMNWHWRKKVKGSNEASNDLLKVPKIDDGLMRVTEKRVNDIIDEVENLTSVQEEKKEANSKENLILSLKSELEREKELTNTWKEKYTSIKLKKMRKCAKIGKRMPSFSFSNCLTLFSNVLPTFNITTNLSKPVETLADHVHKAWSNIKNKWKYSTNKEEESVARQNINRFRKMLSIGNVVTSENPKIMKNKHYNGDNFQVFQNKLKSHEQITFPKPEPIRKMKRSEKVSTDLISGQPCSKRAIGKLKTVFTCGNTQYLEEIDDGYFDVEASLFKSGYKTFPTTIDVLRETSNLPNDVGDLHVSLINGKTKSVTNIGSKNLDIKSRGLFLVSLTEEEIEKMNDENIKTKLIEEKDKEIEFDSSKLKKEENTKETYLKESEELEDNKDNSIPTKTEFYLHLINGKECTKRCFGKLKTIYTCGNTEYLEELDEGYAEAEQSLVKGASNSGDMYIDWRKGKPVEKGKMKNLGYGDLYVDVLNGKTKVITNLGKKDSTEKKLVIGMNDREFEEMKKNENECPKAHLYESENVIEEEIETNVNKGDDSKGFNVHKSEAVDKKIENSKSALDENEEKENWYKRKYDDLSYEFNLYKWNTDLKMKNIMSKKNEELEKEKEKEMLKKKEENLKIKMVKDGLKKEYQKLKKLKKQTKEKFKDWKIKEKRKMEYRVEMVKNSEKKLKNVKNKLEEKLKKAQGILKSYIENEQKTIKNENKKKARMINKVAYFKSKYHESIEETKALRALYNEIQSKWSEHEAAINILQEKMKGYRKLLRENERLEKEENIYRDLNKIERNMFSNVGNEREEEKWRIPMRLCPDQSKCQAEIKRDTKNKTRHIDSTKEKVLNPIPPKLWQFPKSFFTNEKQKISLDNKNHEAIIEKSSPAKQRSMIAIDAEEEEEEKAMPLSWYFYWGQARRSFNGEYPSQQIPLNWYITWMQNRIQYRKLNNMDSHEDDEMNWYLKIMKDREELRTMDVPMSWYSKWRKGKRTLKYIVTVNIR